MITKRDKEEITDVVTRPDTTPVFFSKENINVGTEEMGQEDLNTPILKIIQSNTQDVEDKKEGYLYRTDTHETLEKVLVNLVYVSTVDMENFNKTGMEKVKMYFGFYEGTNEPFKMYVRGWSLVGHRDFQSEVNMIKAKYQLPMFALKVALSTEKQQGTIKESGNPYTTYKLRFDVARGADGKPEIETNQERVNFLFESVQKFKEVALITSENDDKQNEPPFS